MAADQDLEWAGWEAWARPAGPPDRDVLHDLRRQAEDLTRSQRGGPDLLAEASPDLPGPTLSVVGGWGPVTAGFALAYEPRPERVRVEALFVTPDARELGVGESLMNLILDWAGRRGATGVDAIALPGDRATKNFFESHGLKARAILVHRSLPTPTEEE